MKTRTQKAFFNTSSALMLEIITAICGLILPRLILSSFGSSYNGITNSISQFISCIAILKSGIGSVTRAALYDPLARHDAMGISRVINATQKFLRRIAMIFLAFIVVFAALYPLLVSKDFDWLFSFTLVLILSISTFAQYYFGLAYQMVLEADQRNYIVTIVNILSTIANTVISAGLIIIGCGIHTVKLGSALVFVIPPIFYSIYVKTKYSIDTTIEADEKLISQRWDAFAHQIANFINDNTDIIVITIFLGVREVSVYTVYNMVAIMLKKMIMTISNGATAAFGSMIAKKENQKLRLRFRQYELLIFAASTVLLTITSQMYVSFVSIYTDGVKDVNYIRPFFALLICIATFFACVKTPYQQLVYAAGKFKETRNRTIIEAIINIVVSITCVQFIGISGVIVGTICAGAYRSILFSRYVHKNIIAGTKNGFLGKCIYSVIIYLIVSGCMFILPHVTITNFGWWIVEAMMVSVVTFTVAIIVTIIIYKRDFFEILRMIKSLVKKKRK